MEKMLSCLCHIVRLCAAEQGADFVTSKYTRRVLWWKEKGEKHIFYISPTSKEISLRLRIILKSWIS